MLSDVYEPTIDNTNVESMRFEVTDGSSFTELQGRDTTYTVAADPTGMACTVTTASKAGRYKLVATYVTDPARDSVVVSTHLYGSPGLKLYVRLDASINGNGGGGTTNGGADTGVVTGGVPVIGDRTPSPTPRTATTPCRPARAHRRPRPDQASVGYVGTPSDGATMLDQSHTLTTYTSAPDGNVVDHRAPPARARPDTLALGFGRTQSQALDTANRSAAEPFTRILNDYQSGWRGYDRSLRTPPAGTAKEPTTCRPNVIRASEDKSFPGAVVASLASPWGQAVSAADLPDGKPVYFGSYREVFARDLYEAFTGFLTDGDLATPAPPPGSCSTASSCPTAGCRATPSSTARPHPTPAATSSTRRPTRS